MSGQVTTWFMTPEQLAEYVKKHPIKPTKKERPGSFDTDHRGPDYKWRGKKGAEGRWGNKVGE